MLTTVIESRPACVDGTVRTLTLAPDAPPQPWVPGSHVLVQCGPDRAGHPRVNAYSLVGDAARSTAFAISVRNGRDDGGAAWLHRRRVGDRVVVAPPRSAFAPVLSARRHLLVAGGIGVTPILSLARWAGERAEALYVHRPGAGAHADDLAAVCATSTFVDRSRFAAAVDSSLRRQPLGTHLYVCGPAAMVEAVLESALAAGWPRSRCHTEAFAVASGSTRAFHVRLRRSGTVFEVPADRSALDVLDDHGVAVDSLCRRGVCGRCRTAVTAGSVEHRDLFPADDRRMAVCVSRARGTDLVELDL